MFIINQDRDKVIQTKKPNVLFTLPVMHNGKLWGINLYYGDVYKRNSKTLLGTFDSALEVLHEMQRMTSCTDAVYWVTD